MTENHDLEQPPAPWVEFPHATPSWGGWRQGGSEVWLLDVWLPFWAGLNETEKKLYLARYPVPDDDWQMQLDLFWR